MGRAWSRVRVLGAVLAAWSGGGALGDGGRSAFEGYRDLGEGRFAVEVEGAWYVPERIAGTPAQEWLDYAVLTYGVDWFEHFSEDLAGLIERRTGEEVGEAIEVTLAPVGGGEAVVRMLELSEAKAEASDASRRAVEAAMPGTPAWSVRRVERAHRWSSVDEVPSYLSRLTRRLPEGFGEATRVLTRGEAEGDLDQLEWLIEHCHSYRTLRHYDYQEAFDAVRAGLGEGIPLRDFRLQVAQVLAGFGDAHAGVDGTWDRDMVGGWLPFTVREGRRRVLAVGPDGNAFDAVHTAIHSIDGLDIEHWAALGAALVADGSTSFERPRAVWAINWLRHLRAWDGRDPDAPVELRLWTFDKQDPVSMTVELVDEPPVRPSKGEVFGHRLLEGNIGYLRLGSMRIAPAAVVEALRSRGGDQGGHEVIAIESIHEAMRDLRGTAGLVIDVRGNGGGDREVVNVLLPYFMDPAGGAVVVSAAQYRLRPGDDAASSLGFLSDRSMYPMAWDGWSRGELRAINNFREAFDPSTDYAAPREGFSALHFMVVSPAEEGEGPWYRYEAPVVVLMDWYCLSATDVFLGAMGALEGVTLMGQSSGGASGRAVEYELALSGARVALSSMWSYQPGGVVYDTLGVAPDDPVNRELTDMLGTSDLLLERAVRRLTGGIDEDGEAPAE